MGLGSRRLGIKSRHGGPKDELHAGQTPFPAATVHVSKKAGFQSEMKHLPIAIAQQILKAISQLEELRIKAVVKNVPTVHLECLTVTYELLEVLDSRY